MSSDDDKTEPLSKFMENEDLQTTFFDDFYQDKGRVLIVDLLEGQDLNDPSIPFKSYDQALKFSEPGDTILLRPGSYESINLLPGRKIMGEDCKVTRLRTEEKLWSENDVAYISNLWISSFNEPCIQMSKGTLKGRNCTLEATHQESKSPTVLRVPALFLAKCHVKLFLKESNIKSTLFEGSQVSSVTQCDLRIQNEGSKNEIRLCEDNTVFTISRNKIIFNVSGSQNQLQLGECLELQYNYINLIKNGPPETSSNQRNQFKISKSHTRNLFHFYPDFMGQDYWTNKFPISQTTIFEDRILTPQEFYVLIIDGGKAITLTLPPLKDCKQTIMIYPLGFARNSHFLRPQKDDPLIIEDLKDDQFVLETGTIYLFQPTPEGWRELD